MRDARADALTACGMAAFAATELRAAGMSAPSIEEVSDAASSCIAPLLRAAAMAIELAGLCSEECSAGVRDVILDYISVPRQAEPARVAVS